MLKCNEIVIPEDEPFKNDSFENRAEIADVLTNFVLYSTKPMVVCIDAPWGQGKTTFFRMWKQHLKNKKIPTIYFNAWENDFSDDALISLIGEIGSALSELSSPEDISLIEGYFENLKNIGLRLIKRSIPVVAKLTTAGVLDFDALTEEAIAGFAESVAKEQIEKYESSKKSIQEFRKSLKEFATSISKENFNPPLVFIIDELDRCRPTYSVEVLEKAKHFFNVENIVFILGADKEQLGSSIKAIYGEGLNVNGYLRRFIDFDYMLPPPEKGKHVNGLFERFGFSNYFSTKTANELKYEQKHALTIFEDLFELFNLTLREQEHCCSLLSLAIKTTQHNEPLFPIFLCFLIVLKVKNPKSYKLLLNNVTEEKDLLIIIEQLHGGQDFLEKEYGMALKAYIISSKSEKCKKIEVSEKYNNDQRMADLINVIFKEDKNNKLGYLIKKIELASGFKS